MSNFTFLHKHNPIFFQIAHTAEQVFSADPNTTLIKMRQLGEALAQDLAARSGIEFEEYTTQADLIFRLNRKINLDPTIQTLVMSRSSVQFRPTAPIKSKGYSVKL